MAHLDFIIRCWQTQPQSSKRGNQELIVSCFMHRLLLITIILILITNQFCFMSKTSYNIKIFNSNNIHIRIIIIIIIITSNNTRGENVYIFASKTDAESVFAYMCAKVQTEFDLLNISLRCWQLSIWDTTAEIIYETCQQRLNNRLLNLFLYFWSLCVSLSHFNCIQCKNWLTHVPAKRSWGSGCSVRLWQPLFNQNRLCSKEKALNHTPKHKKIFPCEN